MSAATTLDSDRETPFQIGLRMGIEAINFDRSIAAPLWIRRDPGRLNQFNQGVEYGYALHKRVMEKL